MIKETQEILDLRNAPGIASAIELIPIQQVNDAYKQVEKGDVRFRYAIDIGPLKEERAEMAS